ncbi:MAG: AAA family ATPase, partial [Terriglobales bacterium]
YALTDFEFRIATAIPKLAHSHVNAIRFEGGLLNGTRIPFSPHLNCLIGIQGSGKSSALECLRYALNIPFGDKAQDRDYKDALVPYVLKSGGKVVVEATDRHGTRYEIRRIWGHEPDVYVDGKLRPSISVRETIIAKPLYFGQKDLSAQGKGFGQDLVEKLVGESLKVVRQQITGAKQQLETAAESLVAVQDDTQEKQARTEELADITYRLEQFDKHGVKTKLERQVEFGNDVMFCDNVDEIAEEWENALTAAVDEAAESLKDVSVPESKVNAAFFKKYAAKMDALRKTVADAREIIKSLKAARSNLSALHDELDTKRDGLKEEFAKTERELVKALEEQGVT